MEFLCTRPKIPEVSFAAAGRYRGICDTSAERYNEMKKYTSLPERSSMRARLILKILEKNPGSSLRHAKQLLSKMSAKVKLDVDYENGIFLRKNKSLEEYWNIIFSVDFFS